MRRRGWHDALAQALVILVLLWLALGGASDQIRAPLRFASGQLLTLGNVKAAWDTDRWWSMPDLAVADPDTDPLLLNGYAHVDYALVNAAHLISSRVPAVVTLAWALMLVIGAASASWCLRRLGTSRGAAWVAGILYALSPFALAFNTETFGVMPSFVPFAAFAALTLAMGRAPSISDRQWLIVIAGLVLLALNSIYYAIFGGLAIAIGAIAGHVRTRKPASLRAGGAILIALFATTVVNVSTTSSSLDTGTQAQRRADRPSESELFSVKLRTLITPVAGNWIPPLRAWAAKDEAARFPATIGRTALGAVGALGFIGLLIVLFVPSTAGADERGEALRAASRLTLALLLIATTGGFSAVISAVFIPRVTNFTLLVPFLAFFAVTAFAIGVDRIAARRGRPWRVIAWTSVLAIGLVDHGAALNRVIDNRADVTAESRSVRDLVFALEQHLPSGSRVAQLPIQAEPAQQLKMHAFDHLKPYVLSRHLSWTFPATTPDQQRWLNDVSVLPLQALLDRLRADQVAAVVIDRMAYPNDGQPFIEAVQQALSTPAPLVTHNRYAVFDIRKP